MQDPKIDPSAYSVGPRAVDASLLRCLLAQAKLGSMWRQHTLKELESIEESSAGDPYNVWGLRSMRCEQSEAEWLQAYLTAFERS